MSERFVLLSGCSGGGKSTLLEELRIRGHHIVEEPGRRIVKQELERGGDALPWVDAAAFARRAIQVALSDRELALNQHGWIFFDRGLIDAVSALEQVTGEGMLQVFVRSAVIIEEFFSRHLGGKSTRAIRIDGMASRRVWPSSSGWSRCIRHLNMR